MSKDSVAGILYQKSRIFIALRLPQGDMGGKWEFPGGKVEQGETYEQALIREFYEEFQKDIIVGEPLAHAVFNHNNEAVDLYAYRVYWKNNDDSWILSEHSDVAWIELDEIEKLSFVDSDLLLLDQIRKKLL